jgi:hypothetical protein
MNSVSPAHTRRQVLFKNAVTAIKG